MMVRMAPNKNYYRSSSIQGTVGYVAPETLLHKMYSPASDMWQAGVCLYSMLSGFSPFHPKHPEQITEHTYFPMKGVGWDNISDAAKDLISRILVKNVPDRITAQQILQHPWVTTEKAARVDLGSEYFLRIKHLGIRQKMKTFFVENNIEEGNRLRRDHLRMVMPSLHTKPKGDNTASTTSSTVEAGRNPSSCSSNSSQDGMAPATDGAAAEAASIAHIFGTDASDFNAKLKQLKRAVLRRHSARRSMRRAKNESTSGTIPAPVPSPFLPPAPPDSSTPPVADDDAMAVVPERTPSFSGEIDYETYLEIINQCELPELANRQVFSIFDIGNTGTINPKDFLLTMLAFKPEDETGAVEGSGEEAARLYFNIF
ncbi:DCLK3, partial [Symbiodinium microadriaticum]